MIFTNYINFMITNKTTFLINYCSERDNFRNKEKILMTIE